jgi:pyruvate/2-oxoglutarate/acetoin dehydrogenase E1 component
MAETLLFNALREAIDEEMGRDDTVFVLGEDVGQYGGSYKVTKDLYEKYGEFRVLDTPIAENSFTGMAVGAAMTGLRPIIEGMNMGFLLLAFNQIANNAGMLRYTSGGNFKIPMVIRGPGGVGRQLGAEHSNRPSVTTTPFSSSSTSCSTTLRKTCPTTSTWCPWIRRKSSVPARTSPSSPIPGCATTSPRR